MWQDGQHPILNPTRSTRERRLSLSFILNSPNPVTPILTIDFSFTPNQWYRWKAETLKVCLLLVWRVCDQAFLWERPLNGAEKWSRDHQQNWKFAHRYTYKNSLIPKMLLFSIYDENWRSYRGKTVFRTVVSPGACVRLAVVIDVRRQYMTNLT